MTTTMSVATELDADLVRIYRVMLLTRAMDDRIWTLSSQGRIGISGPVRGHEAAQVGSAWALRPGLDIIYPYYRDVGVVLTVGVTALDIMLGALDKRDDPFSGARQMPFHFTSRRLRVPSPSSSVATQIPHAVGAALAARLRGEDGVAIVYFGDGAASKGDFHEGVSFAAIHKLPVIFFCENNQYAISVPLRLQMPVATVAERGPGYGLPGERFDGTSVLETYRATRRAIERAKLGQGPTLLEALVYRLRPHTSHDDDTRYRSREEVQSWEERDPLIRIRSDLLERGLLSPDDERAMAADVEAEVNQALELAEAAPDPERSSAFDHVLHAHVARDPFERIGTAAPRHTPGVFATVTGDQA